MDSDGPGAAAPDDMPESEGPEQSARQSAGPDPGPRSSLEPADPSRLAEFLALSELDQEHEPGPVTQAVQAVGVAPAVVAIMVTHDAGDWLEEAVAALASQTYSNLSVLIVDTGSAIDPTPRIAAVMPGAFVRRLDHDPGYAAALNETLTLVEGASFYCFCHDDVAPDPDAIHLMVEEAFRSNAGIVGPKLVDWDDPELLLQVGLAVDRTGASSPYAERGELDQEQHDAVRDVFTVPGGCTLVRADLFAALGGYDASLDLLGEDLDLSWRAHLAGARVLVAPSARARHREALGDRRPDLDRQRVEIHHRLRTMLACTRLLSLLVGIPRALVSTVVEATLCVATGRGSEARALMSAWGGALRHVGDIRAVRRRVHATRQVSDAEIGNFQIRTAARIAASLQSRHRGTSALAEASRRRGEARRARSSDWSPVVVGVVVLLWVLGSRGLFDGSLPGVADFAPFKGGAGHLLRAFVAAGRDAGVGSTAPPPTSFGVLGLMGWVFGGAMGALRRVLILGMAPIGLWGAWRLARPLQSRRAQSVSLLLYAALPVGINAISQGRWAGLGLYAAAPWLLAALARATSTAPFGPDRERGDDVGAVPTAAPGRRWWVQALGLGLGLAVVGLVAPVVVLVVVLVAVAMVAGSGLALRPRGSGRLLLVALCSGLVGVALHLPWALGWLHPGSEWSVLVGPRGRVGGALDLGHLLRFQSGPFGRTPFGYVLPLAGLLPLLIGRGWRFTWAVRCWSVAVVCVGVVWAGQAGWIGVALPAPEVLLAPAAAALGLAAALGVAAFEADLPGYRFGWRQVASVLTGAALLAGSMPLAASALPGRWLVAEGDFAQSMPFIDQQRSAHPFRVLWLGDQDAVPAGGWRIDDRLVYATTNQGSVRFDDVWAPSGPGRSEALARAVLLATTGQTTRLGAALSRYQVRYVVVPNRDVPLPYRGIDRPPPSRLLVGLAAQLDLRELSVNPAATVYENTAWQPTSSPDLPGAKPGSSGGRAAVVAAEVLIALLVIGLWRRGRRTAAPAAETTPHEDHAATVLAGGGDERGLDGPLRVGDRTAPPRDQGDATARSGPGADGGDGR